MPAQTSLDTSQNYNDTEWHLYTLVVNNTGSAVYIDTTLENQSVQGGDTYNPTTDIYVGGRSDLNVDRFYNGSIDELMIFNMSLNITQITNIYNNQSERFTAKGEHTLRQFNLTLTNENRVNISLTDFERTLIGSNTQLNISARVGAWNISYGYKDNSSIDTGLVAYYHLFHLVLMMH